MYRLLKITLNSTFIHLSGNMYIINEHNNTSKQVDVTLRYFSEVEFIL
jgi:hypothetical protein